ncbi:MAG TPA: NUDIX domain-containing protein [Chthonomonadaceae bacterium]|nr:NUDIX domain-containing protein [Chthonomonadaceae bacterium]
MSHLLTSDDYRAAIRRYYELRQGNGLTGEEMAGLVAEWEARVQPDAKERSENFAVARPDGTTTGVVGPRWIFHLFGLRHRATEIAFRTPSGLIVLQRRSFLKDDWPGAPDMAVAGHIPQREDGSDLTFEEGAWKEIAEEIGLQEEEAAETLVEGRLISVGAPYVSLDLFPERNPPFFNAEVRQVFAATLTGEGLARLHFADNEVIGLLLVTPETAWDMLVRENVASGMRYSLPRYLDWLEQKGG